MISTASFPGWSRSPSRRNRVSALAAILADRTALEVAMAALRKLFGLAPADTRDSLVAGLVAVDRDLYRELIDILENRSAAARDRQSAIALRAIVEEGNTAEE